MIELTHILIVDDDEEILSLLKHFLEGYGHEVSVASNGEDMFALLEAQPVKLIVLDLMIPGEDGLSLCTRVRQTSKIPIIMLTAVTDTTDRIVGLELGADDYLTKPFDQRELLARIKAVLRRTEDRANITSTETRPWLLFDAWRLDISRRELRTKENLLVPLSGREFDLLLVFAEHPQEVLSRDQLLDYAHGSLHDAFDRSIDTQISRLRRKLESNPDDSPVIKTIRGGGYMFIPKVHRG